MATRELRHGPYSRWEAAVRNLRQWANPDRVKKEGGRSRQIGRDRNRLACFVSGQSLGFGVLSTWGHHAPFALIDRDRADTYGFLAYAYFVRNTRIHTNVHPANYTLL